MRKRKNNWINFDFIIALLHIYFYIVHKVIRVLYLFIGSPVSRYGLFLQVGLISSEC